MIFTAPAILTRITALKDGGLSIAFATKELDTKDKVMAFSFYQQYGHLLFKENEIQEEEIPVGDTDDIRKSPSQRLRAVLFVYWRQRTARGEESREFEMFYKQKMEEWINRVKNYLEE